MVNSRHSIEDGDGGGGRAARARPAPDRGLLPVGLDRLRRLRRGGRARASTIPRDLSVAGYDDHPIARVVAPPLTSVDWGMPDVATAAAELLAAALAGSRGAARAQRGCAWRRRWSSARRRAAPALVAGLTGRRDVASEHSRTCVAGSRRRDSRRATHERRQPRRLREATCEQALRDMRPITHDEDVERPSPRGSRRSAAARSDIPVPLPTSSSMPEVRSRRDPRRPRPAPPPRAPRPRARRRAAAARPARSPAPSRVSQSAKAVFFGSSGPCM